MNKQEVRVKVVITKKEGVTRSRDGRLIVSVDAVKRDGRANLRVRELLAEHFSVSMSLVTVVKGHNLPTKTVVIHPAK